MRVKNSICGWAFLIFTCFSPLVKAQYTGGENDGFSESTFCCSSLTGPLSIGTIVGNSTFCDSGMELYSVSLFSGTATGFTWTLPTGASVVTTRNTSTSSMVNIKFGTTAGNISVTATDGTTSVTSANLAVTSATCAQFFGGVNDGFAVATLVNVPLPVTLVSFYAEPISTGVRLSWTTASEHSNQSFTLEKSNTGKVFHDWVNVAGAGTSTVQKSYTYLDKNPYKGNTYYRLKQTDYDGQVTYSEVVSVTYRGEYFEDRVELFPNPTSTKTFNLQFSPSLVDTDATVSIRDLMGRFVMYSLNFTSRSTIQVKIPENVELKEGVYLVLITIGGRQIINRLVIN